jgi:hypothetical protein
MAIASVILKVDPPNATGKSYTVKSAYELAMERLEKAAPSTRLTDAQKREIAEIESSYRARIAEKEVFLNGEIGKARASGDAEAVTNLEQQLAREVARLRESCEAKKEQVRAKSAT